MACDRNGEKKTFVSTVYLELKPAVRRSSLTNCRESRTENGAISVPQQTDNESADVTTGTQKSDQGSEDVVEMREMPKLSTETINHGEKEITCKIRASDTGSVVEFLETLDKVHVHLGETANLHVSFNGSGPTASCWIHNRKKLVVDGGRVHIECHRDRSILTISEVLPEDTGSYTLYVRNRHGIAEHTTLLSIQDRPEHPTSCPTVSRLTSTSLELSWCGPSYDGGSAVTDYIVEMQTLGPSGSGNWTELTAQCKNTSYRVCSGLQLQRKYRFRVRACNANGISDPSLESDIIKMETTDDKQEDILSPVECVVDSTHRVKDHYNIHEKLGVGKFGQVFKLMHKESGRVCAGKFYRAVVSKDKEAARKEIELMRNLRHPKLVQCLGAYDTRSEIAMIMEYIAGGELFERIVDDSFEHTEPSSVEYMRQILQGIQYVHCKNIVHLDLKPENIVCVNSTGLLIKIIDFGLARTLEPGKPITVMHGTPEFVAPEVINYEPVDLSTDMWSIGVICYILLSGESPFQGNNDSETLALVTAASWEFTLEFDGITDEAKDFISQLMKKEKRSRMSCEQALMHQWIASPCSPQVTKALNKDKIKRFLARQRWHKTGKALLALNRMTHLSHRSDASDSPSSTNTDAHLSKEAEHAVASLERQLKSEPSFPRTLCDLTEPCGATVHLACMIQGYPDPAVEWLLDDVPLEETERVRIEYKENGICTLTLARVRPEDSGMYKCRASNHLGEALCAAKLTVANKTGTFLKNIG